MRKEHILPSITTKVLLSIFLLSLTTLIPFNKAHAQTACDDAPWYKLRLILSCRLKEVNPMVALTRTIGDSANELMTGVVTGVVLNSSPDELGTCGSKLLYERMVLLKLDPNENLVNMQGQPLFPQGTDPGSLENAYKEGQNLDCDYNSTILGSRSNGSLMGVTKQAYNIVSTEPIPVNLAFYFQTQLSKIPLINRTALAQTSYPAWGLELVQSFWTATRDIAYAMMSVIMLIIGILIITRSKISPQVSLTVQQALPRVIISLILITFSYPIGAIFTSAIIPLSLLVFNLFFSQVIGQLGQWGVTQITDMNVLVMITTIFIQTIGPQGAIGLVTANIMILMTLVAMIIIVVKMLFIQVKMLLAIVLAPIQFAIGAIPGQDKIIEDWFKHMLARALAIPAMFFMVGLAWYVLIVPFINPTIFQSLVTKGNVFGMTFSFFRAVASRSLTILLLPIITTMIMFSATKADKVVEDFIMGPQKPGGKR